MGPYLAVIKDSFREAMASHILWVLFVVITLVLLALAPFGYSERTTTHLQDGDLPNFGDFVARVQAAGEGEEKSPSRRIWDAMKPQERESLKKFKPGKNPDGFAMMRIARQFISRLNKLIDSKDFYDKEYFAKTRMLTVEGRDLLKRYEDGETLSDTENSRLNRLVLESAFPDVINAGMATSLQFRYLFSEMGRPFPISRSDFNQQVKGWASFVMKWFVGVVGIVVAILVTSFIIPQMFDPGSLHLLLSNPVSRSLLFLAKYLGGCAFTFLTAAYLIGGLWMLLGIRFGIWEINLLYSIPLYVFVFAIYYAVSALAGVIWRNPLISIALSVLFWLACLSMGYAKGIYEQFALSSSQFRELHLAGDTLLAVNTGGTVKAWNEGDKDWEEVFMSDSQQAMQFVVAMMPEVPDELRPMGPAYDAKNDRLVNVTRDMQAGGILVMTVGERDKEWEARKAAPPPSGMVRLVSEPDGNVLAISSYGLYRLTGDPFKKPEKKSLLGVIPLPNMSSGPFESVGPEPAVILTRPYATAVNPKSGNLVFYSRGEVTVLEKQDDGKFVAKAKGGVDVPSGKAVKLACTGDSILVGRQDGALLIYDAKSLELKKEINPEPNSFPQMISSSPDGSTYAVTYKNGNLWWVRGDKLEVEKPSVRGQGDIGATKFKDDKTILITYQSVRVFEYDMESAAIEQTFAPSMGTFEFAYRYGIYPLYVVFPKPSELDRTIEYTLASKEEANKIEKPFQPVWSSLLFIVGVLVLSCIYIERQEF